MTKKARTALDSKDQSAEWPTQDELIHTYNTRPHPRTSYYGLDTDEAAGYALLDEFQMVQVQKFGTEDDWGFWVEVRALVQNAN